MMRACPTCGAALRGGLCRRHGRPARLRTSAERGYGAEFQAARRGWAQIIAAGAIVRCARGVGCLHPEIDSGGITVGGRIRPGDRWDLGHDDLDRRIVRGPEHPDCNRGAANRQVRA